MSRRTGRHTTRYGQTQYERQTPSDDSVYEAEAEPEEEYFEAEETVTGEPIEDGFDADISEAEEIADESPESLQERIAELEAQLATRRIEKERDNGKLMDLNSMYVRLQSDFDNYRKRTNEQMKSMKTEGAADVIGRMIPVLDVIGQALQMITDEKVAEGVQMINRQILDVFASYGVTEIAALGKEFDPEIHNAILQVPAENPEMSGLVIEVLQKGYRMGDKILRHSVVKVAR